MKAVVPEWVMRRTGPLSGRTIRVREPAMSAMRRLVMEERARERRHEWDRIRQGVFVTENVFMTSEATFGVVRLPASLLEKPLDGDVLYPWRRRQD